MIRTNHTPEGKWLKIDHTIACPICSCSYWARMAGIGSLYNSDPAHNTQRHTSAQAYINVQNPQEKTQSGQKEINLFIKPLVNGGKDVECGAGKTGLRHPYIGPKPSNPHRPQPRSYLPQSQSCSSPIKHLKNPHPWIKKIESGRITF